MLNIDENLIHYLMK